jgi:hypothetical protein
MRTDFRILYVDGAEAFGTYAWPRDPGLERIKGVVMPVLSSARPGARVDMERVRVLFDGLYVSMFVDEIGAKIGLPVNRTASKIYHANELERRRRAGYDMPVDGLIDGAPMIHGHAVLFTREVWF